MLEHGPDRRRAARVPPHPARAAAAAGLRHLADDRPGIRRVRSGRSFRYLGPRGVPVRDAETLARIRRLAIPPAWADVWISCHPRGHVQATGRDKRGRKQYRYHPAWCVVRDHSKYGRLLAFGRALPGVRARVDHDLRRKGLPREKVLATVVRLLERTLIRVGNEEYVRHNGSFGLTTLRKEHAEVRGSRIRFWFRGKTGKRQEVRLRDRRLGRIVTQCRELPGKDLFRYVDGNERARGVTSQDVNAYLRDVAGEQFTAKDFRTWSATVRAAWALHSMGTETKGRAKRNLARAVEEVAARLGNTPTVCRKSYVHPLVIDAYVDGTLAGALATPPTAATAGERPGLHQHEQAVLGLLYRRLGQAAGSRRARGVLRYQVRGAK